MCSIQISGMSLWNYGPDVMDVLVELVVALVCTFTDLQHSNDYNFFCRYLIVL